ncbi:MAG: PQQ-binding-like beta-propeller repeat protein [Bacteroidetes bacterium]|nr:PQQ-binding-like beta-propeller repeat protein [Bacteroidota bacterium]
MKIKILILLLLVVNHANSQLIENPNPLPVDITAKPDLLWKFKTNGPIVGTPVIDGGTAFIGSLDSALYALDLATGKLKWKLLTGGPIRSSACIATQRLFLLSSDGYLYRMDKDSGRVDGIFQTMTGYLGDLQHDYADYYNSTPVIVDSTIYFGSGEYVYALSITDGYLRWTYKTGGLVHSRPAISKNWLYAGSFDGNLYAIDRKTGTLAWKFKTTGKYSFPTGEVTGSPVIAAGMVFTGARDYNLYAIDMRGGFCNWMKQFSSGWSLPVTANDTVIYVGTADDRSLFAFDIRTGRQLWQAPAGFIVSGGCAIGKKMGYFGTLGGKVHGVDLTNGEIKWTAELDSYKANHLDWLKPNDAFRDDIVKLIVTPLDMHTMYRKLGGIFGAPALDGNNLVVAGYDGWVYCYSAEAKK